MKKAEKLREEMCEVFDDLKSGTLPPATARELTKSTTAQISLAKVQLMYAAACGVKPKIPFLDME